MTEREHIAAALGDYDIGVELGRGTCGVVYGGYHRGLGREVAIKRLPDAFLAQPEVRARFKDEARVLAKLDHPHIVRVFDFVDHDDLCLIVMEKLSGGTVYDLFEGGGFRPDQACAVAVATCSALDHAHRFGVVHRDIKPDNLMMAGDGALKVTDFGIAKVLGGGATLVTRAGTALGTAAYMAPEQAEDSPPGPAADIYSSGLVLYLLLAGRLPFSMEGGDIAVMHRHVYEKPQPLGELAPQLPSGLVDAVMRALETDPRDRYADAAEFTAAIVAAGGEAWGSDWLDHVGGPVVLPPSVRPAPSGPRSAGPPVALVPVRPTDPAVRPRDPATLPDPRELRPIGDLLPRPRVLPALATALALLAASALLAFLGPGRSGPPTDVRPAVLTVNGVDPAAAGTVPLDLAQPVVVAAPEPGSQWTSVHLALAVMDRDVVEADAAAMPRDDGSRAATFDLAGSLRLVAGRVTTTVKADVGAGSEGGSFPAGLAVPWFATVPGGLVIALLLFAGAYTESILRRFRAGVGGAANWAGIVVVGALGGAGLAALSWVTGARLLAWPVIAGCALGCAAAGVAAASASRQLAKRRASPRSDPGNRAVDTSRARAGHRQRSNDVGMATGAAEAGSARSVPASPTRFPRRSFHTARRSARLEPQSGCP